MPQITALSVKDGAATPVTHTFQPVTTNGAKAEWADRSAGLPTAYLKIQHEVRQPATATAAFRVIAGFNIPVSQSVAGVDTVVRNSSASVTLNLSPQSTEQERADLLAYVANFLALPEVKTSVKNIEPFF